MSSQGLENTRIVREKLEEACKAFTVRMGALGFTRSKKMFWTRRHEHTVEVIHLHRDGSSYGAPTNFKVSFRIHLAIRVLNDAFEAVALNGPMSDGGRLHEGAYHLSFNAHSGDKFERCVDDLARFVADQGEPWFTFYREPSQLLTYDSPLQEGARNFLQLAINGMPDLRYVATSLKLLGLKA